MPDLHLPAEHSPSDLVLAHRVARAVESSELHVVWSHDAGAGQRPEVRARVRQEPSTMLEVLAAVLGWISTALDAVFDSSRARAQQPPPGPERRGSMSVEQ